MQDKTKFIIIGLIGFLVISIFIGLQAFGGKQIAERERDAFLRSTGHI